MLHRCKYPSEVSVPSPDRAGYRLFGVCGMRFPWKMMCLGALAVTCAGLACPANARADTVAYQVVTNEIKAKQADGSKAEVYRFDPAVYVVQQNDDVVLNIRGLKGQDHPFVLQGYNIHGTIHKNQVTALRFKATKPGFFRLVCTSHADSEHEGPMEAYLVVVPVAHT